MENQISLLSTSFANHQPMIRSFNIFILEWKNENKNEKPKFYNWYISVFKSNHLH
jgi:hypothetical protein